MQLRSRTPLTNNTGQPLRVLLWGTGDNGKPRVRILKRALEELHVDVTDCRYSIWEGVEDKSQLTSVRRAAYLMRWVFAYPRLIWRYLRSPKHDVVLVTYPGQLDVLVLWPFAKIRRADIAWDIFLSWYDAAIVDRKIVSKFSPLAWPLYAVEWLACRAADGLFMDTATHARYIEQLFYLPPNSVGRVFVGVEPEAFTAAPHAEIRPQIRPKILFYGQFIPLHGIETIIQAAAQLERIGVPMDFVIVGRGQTQPLLDEYTKRLCITSIERKLWVPYTELKKLINDAQICLGIFSASGKAGRVIPNKVFQILALGKPLITRDSPAIRELVKTEDAVTLVPAGDSRALADAINTTLHDSKKIRPVIFGPREVAEQLAEILTKNV